MIPSSRITSFFAIIKFEANGISNQGGGNQKRERVAARVWVAPSAFISVHQRLNFPSPQPKEFCSSLTDQFCRHLATRTDEEAICRSVVGRSGRYGFR